jgi:predicted transcriptional regulator
MLAKTLQKIIDEKWSTAREIGELAGVSTSTVYRWIAGESQPDFNAVRLLLRHIPHPRAQEAILGVFASGTSWQFLHADLELDINSDGRVDAEDAMDASCKAVRAAAESLQTVRAACRGKSPTAEETLDMIALLNQVVRHCTIAQRVLVEIAEQRSRKQLKIAR